MLEDPGYERWALRYSGSFVCLAFAGLQEFVCGSHSREHLESFGNRCSRSSEHVCRRTGFVFVFEASRVPRVDWRWALSPPSSFTPSNQFPLWV